METVMLLLLIAVGLIVGLTYYKSHVHLSVLTQVQTDLAAVKQAVGSAEATAKSKIDVLLNK